MPYDMDEGRMLGELQDLEDEIAVLNAIVAYKDSALALSVVKSLEIRYIERTIKRLRDMKYHQEMRLRIHRHKVKESGVKY